MRRSRGKTPWIAICIASIGLMAILAYWLIVLVVGRFVSARESERHVYDIESSREFLTDEDAIRLAEETMVAEGYKLADWKPEGSSWTRSPSGKKDRYLSRSGLDPHAGYVVFVDAESGRRSRIVEISVTGRRATTYVLIPK